MKKTFGFLLIFALPFIGCRHEPVRDYDSLGVAIFDNQPSERKPYGTVKVYQTTADIPRPYIVIGLMTREGDAGDEAEILNAMLYRAADMGADGVLLNPNSEPFGKNTTPNTNSQSVSVRWGWAALMGDNSNQRLFRAQAIRLKN